MPSYSNKGDLPKATSPVAKRKPMMECLSL